MKQKVSLCCSLMHDPDLLILDEPTTGVDPLSRRQFWELIDSIRARRPHMSVIVATAYMDEASRFDWLAAMDDGKVIAHGTPKEILARTQQEHARRRLHCPAPAGKAWPASGRHRAVRAPESDDKTPAIEAEGLTRRFGDFVAVDHVSFRIERGEIFGFLGSNGCGKTTTMKMMTGLLPVTEGSAKLFGKPMGADDMEARQNVGYMSQAFSLYSELTVRQNLELHAHLYHLPPNEIESRINRAARTIRPEGCGRRQAGKSAARRQAAAAASGGRAPPAAYAHSGRAHFGRRSGRPRRVLAYADRSLPQRWRHDLSIDPLHERGRTLRPYLADASRAGARCRSRRRSWSRSAASAVSGGRFHLLSGGGSRNRREEEAELAAVAAQPTAPCGRSRAASRPAARVQAIRSGTAVGLCPARNDGALARSHPAGHSRSSVLSF